MKKFLIIISAILLFLCIGNTHPVLAIYIPPASGPGCDSGTIFTMVDGSKVHCGSSWDGVNSADGVLYHCTCNCSTCDCPCVPVSVAGSSGSSGPNGKANFGSDSTGQAFFTPEQITELQDWAKNNSQKWDAFEARALQNGYPNLDALLRAASSGMPFNDFAIREIMKYINDYDTRLVRNDSEIPNATFYKGYDKNKSNNTSLVRDDSEIPSASFYGGNGKNKSPAKDPKKEGTPLAPPKPGKTPDSLVVNDNGGVYIGSGKIPVLLRNNPDTSYTREEREAMHLNSLVDQNSLVRPDAAAIQNAQAQAEKEQQLKGGGRVLIDTGEDALSEKGVDITSGYLTKKIFKTMTEGLGGDKSEELGRDAGTALSVIGRTESVVSIIGDVKSGKYEDAGVETFKLGIGLIEGAVGSAAATGIAGGQLMGKTASGMMANFIDNTNDAVQKLGGKSTTGGLSGKEWINQNCGNSAIAVFVGFADKSDKSGL